MGGKSSLKVVGYSHSICATIATMHISCQIHCSASQRYLYVHVHQYSIHISWEIVSLDTHQLMMDNENGDIYMELNFIQL